MKGFPDLQATTKVLSDQSRLEILTILMDGKYHNVSELAKKTKIKSHTASYHLKQLCELNWVVSYKQGRNVYYHLCSEDIAELLEKLMNISPVKEISSFNESVELEKLKKGRSCYRHLAGKIGVDFFYALVQKGCVKLENNNLELTDKGVQYFESLGMEINLIKKQQGIFIKPCLDWTEQTFHLGGNLGKAFFRHCEEKNYLILNKENRSVCLTNAGEIFFADLKLS
ncbi:ArsR/SmtB family transcription factor [Listeria seeligeri]|uniref:ArsR/SmtB family transcription factor n=1 Tax=Listeria seeligeri TaxID=1640 RepID=UPI001623301D|nr:metalloregulator ArsR/SmtB family transcription factor [Listeria seeligeri]MBC1422599.1 winged helix-turn-helix transcriptional regulator [Listeria seeligeri]MBC1752118.1 winged helix-turn-helix transcriptional regulator [Listeria seeligeri]MBC1830932.1 winged helix-turn-helix transcriptional regulator [Listeria seeligeri]MBC1842603.1 winged helix-turn-helix transcriptional regulator [Listeria seeligeri]